MYSRNDVHLNPLSFPLCSQLTPALDPRAEKRRNSVEQIGEERGEHHVLLTLQRTQSSGEPTDLTTLTVFQYQYLGYFAKQNSQLEIYKSLFICQSQTQSLFD